MSLTLACDFAPRDVGIYPSRGAAGVRGSRFFADGGIRQVDGEGTPGFFWIADEPGFFKFTLPASAPVVASGVEVLPAGNVFFNAKIEIDTNVAVDEVETPPGKGAVGVSELGKDRGEESGTGTDTSTRIELGTDREIGLGISGAMGTAGLGTDGAAGTAATARGDVSLVSGVATVKRTVPASFMGADVGGILAEYIVVGTFTATRRN